MVLDMGYWTRVFKKIITLIITVLGLYIAFKMALFYIPFLIAFIIAVMIEPLIKIVHKKTRLARKVSAILVLAIVSCLIIGLLIWGITSLISESSNFLTGFNDYVQKAYIQVQDIIERIDLSKMQVPEQVTKVLQDSTVSFVDTVSTWAKNALTSLINVITSIPTIAIYTVITLLATYFICADRFYILDQLEHHLPKTWVRKIGVHLREIISSLGGYLKAEATLLLISFSIVLAGLLIMSFIGFNVQYPFLAAIGIGLVDALPIVGSGTIIIPWAIASALNGNIELAIGLLVIYGVTIIVKQILEPKIVSKNIGIHPIFTLIAMYTGFKLSGVIGLFIGPIILIILKNIFSTLIDRGVIKAIFDRA